MNQVKYFYWYKSTLNFIVLLLQILVGLTLLLLSYVILLVRSFILAYHGYKHDILAMGTSSGGDDLHVHSLDGSGGVVVGRGHYWASMANCLHDIVTMMNASFEEGFGVWGGKNTEIGIE